MGFPIILLILCAPFRNMYILGEGTFLKQKKLLVSTRVKTRIYNALYWLEVVQVSNVCVLFISVVVDVPYHNVLQERC
jgi:hypothetical protein